jgi:hypothetical protein
MDFKRRTAYWIAAGACLACAPIWADHPSAGMYEVKVQIENSALGLSQTQNTKQCITAGHFEKDPQTFLYEQQQGLDCRIQDYSMANGKISMRMSCEIPGGGETVIRGDGTYSDTGFTLTNTMTMEMAGTKMTMKTIAEGKRIGDC